MKRMWSLNQLRKIGQETEKDINTLVDADGNKVYEYFDGELIPEGAWLTSGLTFDALFIKAIRNFGELQFIVNFRATNNTESTITIANDKALAQFSIPSYLKEKVIAHNGHPTSENNQGSIAYCALFVSYVGGSFDTLRYANLINSAENILMYNEGGTISVNAGGARDFEARISLAI